MICCQANENLCRLFEHQNDLNEKYLNYKVVDLDKSDNFCINLIFIRCSYENYKVHIKSY
jgi:hypothetical protein